MFVCTVSDYHEVLLIRSNCVVLSATFLRGSRTHTSSAGPETETTSCDGSCDSRSTNLRPSGSCPPSSPSPYSKRSVGRCWWWSVTPASWAMNGFQQKVDPLEPGIVTFSLLFIPWNLCIEFLWCTLFHTCESESERQNNFGRGVCVCMAENVLWKLFIRCFRNAATIKDLCA